MPHRAEQLKNADPTKPESIWPHLKIISCWGDGHAKLARDEIQRHFPSVFVQPKGLLATECAVTIPFCDSYPLAITSHFFEFADEQGQIFLAHELEKGKIYEVIVTTSGGLWRYRLQDQVEVTGFISKTPSLRFLRRTGNVSDQVGEKLSEYFVANVVQKALGETMVRFVLLAPDNNGLGCRYTLYVEGDVKEEVSKRMEELLSANPHYAWCRKIDQLKPLKLFQIKANGYESFVVHQQLLGKRLGNIKPAVLSDNSGWSKVFSGCYLE